MNRTVPQPAWKVALNANTASLRKVAERLAGEVDDLTRLNLHDAADSLLDARLDLTRTK